MSEFAFLYRGRDTTSSPEQMQKTTQKWMAWFKQLGTEGHIKEMGHPLENAGAVVRGSQKTIHDGPFAEAKDVIGGFTVVIASDISAAAELARGCPILEVGGSVEVRPIQQMKM